MGFNEVTREQLMSTVGAGGSVSRCAMIFHWSECGPCKRTLPEYIKAGQGSKESFLSIERDQAMIAPSLLVSFQVRSFPTIVWWDRHAKECPVFPKTLPRTAENIRAWVEQQAATSSAATSSSAIVSR